MVGGGELLQSPLGLGTAIGDLVLDPGLLGSAGCVEFHMPAGISNLTPCRQALGFPAPDFPSFLPAAPSESQELPCFSSRIDLHTSLRTLLSPHPRWDSCGASPFTAISSVP